MFLYNSIIGLDIGAESVKLVELNHKKDGIYLSTYGSSSHDSTVSGYWDTKTISSLSNIIEKILDRGRFESVKAIASVTSKDVYVTILEFEKSTGKKYIQNQINNQSKYFLPYPPNEMRLSWSLLKNNPQVDKQRVLVNALPDFVISNVKNILEYVNLDGLSLENQTLSQIRCLLQGDSGVTILVDIGGSYTSFSLIEEGILKSSSYVEHGVDRITKDLSEYLDISYEAADEFKKDLSMVNLYQIPNIINENLQIIKSELEIFTNLSIKSGHKVSKIVLTGGGVYTAGLVKFLNQLHPDVVIGNPTKYIQFDKNIKPYISPFIHQYTTAIGLAMKPGVI